MPCMACVVLCRCLAAVLEVPAGRELACKHNHFHALLDGLAGLARTEAAAVTAGSAITGEAGGDAGRVRSSVPPNLWAKVTSSSPK